MGKRKQELPRKLPADSKPNQNEEHDISKLENIVKKLKTSSSHSQTTLASTCPVSPSKKPEALSDPIAFKSSLSIRKKSHDNKVGQMEPLDLSLSAQSSSSATRTHLSVERRPHVSQVKTSRALDLSANHNGLSSITPSFQELSEKLEEYFSSGIVASKFPRKMVRGQDVWIQDVEQKRAILKCLKCAASYNTLAELAKHLKKSGHHDEVPSAVCHLPIMESSPTSSLISNCEQHGKVKINDHFLRGPSAFKPITSSRALDAGSRDGLLVGQLDDFSKYSVRMHGSSSSGSANKESFLPKKRSSEAVRAEREVKECSGSVTRKSVEMQGPLDRNADPNPNPLSALKKFLDSGIPRLKPLGLGGGRI